MGKQSRRKKRNARSNKNAKSSVSSASSSNATPLLQRIRHADPRTRHAALTALNVTLLDPDQLQRGKGSTTSTTRTVTVSSSLLEATRERVMDDDLECAQAAAGCLANYLSFGSSRQGKDESLTAGWTLVFLQRLQQALVDLKRETKATTAVGNKERKQWLALGEQCLYALCALVETNPRALDRICANEATILDFVNTMMGWFQLACGTAADSQKSHDDDQEQKYIQDIAVYSIRTLHSALDDNLYVLQTWLDAEQVGDGWTLIHHAAAAATADSRSTDGTLGGLPIKARLHAAACLITARQLLCSSSDRGNDAIDTQEIHPQEQQQWMHTFHSQVVQTVLPMLLSDPLNVMLIITDLSAQAETYHQALQLVQQQEADVQLENDVIQSVRDQTKEPAKVRLQAKLKRKQKQEQQQQEQQDSTTSTAEDMEQDNDKTQSTTTTTTTETSQNKQRAIDAREALQEAQQSWQEAVSPLQLALEVVANLTSIGQQASCMEEEQDRHDNDIGGIMAMDEDDIGMDELHHRRPQAWGPQQEAALMANDIMMETTISATHCSPLDAALLNALGQSQLANRLVHLLKSLCTALTPHDDGSSPLPLIVQMDIDDLQSKCAACLGNCIANLGSEQWSLPLDLWKDCLRPAAQQLSINNINSRSSSSSGVGATSSSGKEGVFNCMVLGIRTRPELRKQIEDKDVDFFLQQLLASSSSAGDTASISDSIKRDVVCILGVLCSSESHSDEVNHKVCSGLLFLLQSTPCSAMVMSEVLNALMDMYGDDGHSQVFDSLDVLGNFQRILPRFKKQIQADARTKNDVEAMAMEVLGEDVEQWRETALNASRFIGYKKGQL